MKNFLIGLAAGGLMLGALTGGAFARVATPGETQFYSVGAECGVNYPSGSGIFGTFQGTAIAGEGSIVRYDFVVDAQSAGISLGSQIGTSNSGICGN